MPASPPRYAPERPFPPYAFTRGITPHPRADPGGHSVGAPQTPPSPLDPERWETSEDYRYGVDLFNNGFFWEAHEAWEGLWIACGRRGPVAAFLKGLIKLAAAALKARTEEREGALRHARSAATLLRSIAEETGGDRYAGLDLGHTVAIAERLEQTPSIVEPLLLRGDGTR